MSTTMERVALVTGANKGSGFETSRQLARQGITVIMASRDIARGKAAVKILRDEGLNEEFIQLDVARPEHIGKAASEIEWRYGKLDILVNNAGISVDNAHGQNSTETVSPRTLRKTFDVNFFGLVELTKKLLLLIRKAVQAGS